MNAKHYVSLEAAKKLKEINHDGLDYEMHITDNGIIRPTYVVGNVYPAPTLLEAMDWLESKGIYISIKVSLPAIERKKNMYSYDVLIKEGDGVRRPNVDVNWYSRHANRNECLQKAIEKALELL